jgi:hypothetical protein
MTYAPPSGWIERTDEHTDALTRVNARFHSRTDCERIKNPGGLVQVDKPLPRAPLPGLRARVTAQRPRCFNLRQDRRGCWACWRLVSGLSTGGSSDGL